MNVQDLRYSLKSFLEAICVKHDPEFGFTLASGAKSDLYIDCKPAVLNPLTLGFISDLMLMKAEFAPVFTGVAGVVAGGIPLATAFSLKSNKPAILVRRQPKDHGTKKLVEKGHDRISSALILEDVVTTGVSSVRIAQILREEGITPVGVLAIVDRQEGAVEAILEQGMWFNSLFNRGDFVTDGEAA